MQENKEITPIENGADLHHLPAGDKPEVGTTYEIRPDGPVSVRFDAHDPEDPQHGWSSIKRWRGEIDRGCDAKHYAHAQSPGW